MKSGPRLCLTLGLAFAFLAGPGPFDPSSAKLPSDETITIEAEPLPIPTGYSGLGPLRPVAALRLSSKDARFGGLSGLHVEPNGKFVAISDRGFWLSGRMIGDKDTEVLGIGNARIGKMRDTGGVMPTLKRGDSEGLTRLRSGKYAVSFELEPRVSLFDYSGRGAAARPRPGPVLGQVSTLAPNQELEALTTLANGWLLAGSERGAAGNSQAILWTFPPTGSKRPQPSIPPLGTIDLPSNYSLTELAGAPDGSFYALFRSYTIFGGAKAQLQHFQIIKNKDKVTLKGGIVAQLQPPFPTDNYEGMALTTRPDGSQRLYVISDDNYRSAQTTILLVFEVPSPAKSP